MSIQSEINRIKDEVDTQAELIEQIRAVVAGKVAGSESAEPVLQDKTITENGTYTADSGYDGLGTVTVNVTSSSESGGTSGGTVDTCTVIFDNFSADGSTYINALAATVVDNGVIKPYLFDKASNGCYLKYTIQNVVCGSTILFNFEPYTHVPYIEIDGSAIYESYYRLCPNSTTNYAVQVIITAPTTPNEECTIYYAYEP